MSRAKLGMALFLIGIIYMVLEGWVISWIYVYEFWEAGPDFLNSESLIAGQTFFAFWALSIPLGALLSGLGLAIHAKVPRVPFILYTIGGLIMLAWLGLWSKAFFWPFMYGLGGGIILYTFCTAIWYLSRIYESCPSKYHRALEYRALAYICLVTTAWGLCGLLGVPSFGLRPEYLLTYELGSLPIIMGSKIMICFTLGWIFLALSQRHEFTANYEDMIWWNW